MSVQLLLSTRKHSPAAAEQIARQVGFDGIELVLPWRDTDIRHAEYRRLTTVRAVHAPVTDFTEDEFRESLNRARQVADMCQVRRIVCHPAPLCHGDRCHVLNCIKVLKEYDAHAICYEVLPAPGSKPKHIRQQAYHSVAAWAADVHEHRLLATLDTTHVASWREDPAAWVTLLGERLCHVHVSDYNPKTGEQHLFIGDGAVDFGSFFHALKSQHHSSELCVTLEPAGRFELEKYIDVLRESLGIMRRALAA